MLSSQVCTLTASRTLFLKFKNDASTWENTSVVMITAHDAIMMIFIDLVRKYLYNLFTVPELFRRNAGIFFKTVAEVVGIGIPEPFGDIDYFFSGVHQQFLRFFHP